MTNSFETLFEKYCALEQRNRHLESQLRDILELAFYHKEYDNGEIRTLYTGKIDTFKLVGLLREQLDEYKKLNLHKPVAKEL